MKKILLSMLAAAVLLSGWSVCPAQESKTVLTVAFSGYDELKADLNFIGSLADNPNLADGLEAMLTFATQGQGLAGLDKSKRWGAIVQTDGQKFSVFGFLPVSDLKALLGVAARLQFESNDIGDGVFEIPIRGNPVFAKEKNGWVVIAPSSDALDTTPGDPAKVLDSIPKKYDLAVRASIQNIPPPVRQQFIEQVRQGAQYGLLQMPNESAEQYALRKAMATRTIDQIVAMANELDEALVGWAVDSQAGVAYLDIEVKALPGTNLATQFAAIKPGKTNFAGFDLPGAAVTGNWTGTLSQSDVAQAKSNLATARAAALSALDEEGLADEEMKLATELLGDLFDVFEKTVENKQLDGGMVVMLEPGNVGVAGGGVIVEGGRLEKVAKRIATLAGQDKPDVAKMIKLNAETHQDVRFHTASIPIPEDTEGREQIVAVFGETINVVLGVSDDSVYVAAGRNPASLLKQVIDSSKAAPGKQGPPVRIAIAATPIAKLVAQVALRDDRKAMAEQIAGVLEQSGGKDHITITTEPIPSGSRTHVEIEQGILKLIGSAGQMMPMGVMPGGGKTPGPMPGGGETPGGEAPEKDNPFDAP